MIKEQAGIGSGDRLSDSRTLDSAKLRSCARPTASRNNPTRAGTLPGSHNHPGSKITGRRHRRDAPQPRSRRLANGTSDLRLPSLQPTGRDQSRQCSSTPIGLDAGYGRRPPANSTSRVRRYHVRCSPERRRPHPGLGCHNLRFAVGLSAPPTRRSS
jgi:hypothetical protein